MIAQDHHIVKRILGGSGEIRTHGAIADSTVFKTVDLNHSSTLPETYLYAIHVIVL